LENQVASTYALKIIALAEKAKMKMQVGAFMESAWHDRFCTSLLLCSDEICTAILILLNVYEDPVSGGLTYHENGVVKCRKQRVLEQWMKKVYG